MIDLENRWIYKGSRTVPPCTGPILWEVVRKIYPIGKQEVVWFQEKLSRAGADTGNYRVIQTKFNEDIAFISSGATQLLASIYTLMLISYFAY